jgi:N-methylhydantoinase B/oxoprolinase/acetone carboxylase alpha subunit
MKSVKENLHSLIDAIGDEMLLESVYEILQQSNAKNQGTIWKSLTEKQQEEVIQAADNLDDARQLPNSAMIEKNKKWLSQ